MPASQAGRRRFDPGRPLHPFTCKSERLEESREDRDDRDISLSPTYHPKGADERREPLIACETIRGRHRPALGANRAGLTCEHEGARTLWNKEAGIAFRADCGDRRVCGAARRRKIRELRARLSRVEYFRAPDLWTFTARTAEQDALVQSQRYALALAHDRAHDERRARAGKMIFPWIRPREIPRDRGDVNKPNLEELNRGCERVKRAVKRQAERERRPGYRRTRHAAMLHRRYGTDRVVRGRPGADFRICVRESGELHGRLHLHAASDFDFLHKLWLQDHCYRCGLGFCEFERRDTKALHSAARFSGRRVRGATIAHYLAKYLSTPDQRPWPWPNHARLVSSGRGILPPRETKPGWRFTWRKVSRVAIEELGAVVIDDDATFYRRDDDPSNLARAPGNYKRVPLSNPRGGDAPDFGMRSRALHAVP